MKAISSNLRNGMKLILTVPETEIYRQKNTVVATIALFGIIVSAIMILLTTSIINRIIRLSYKDVITEAGNKNAYQEEINRMEKGIHYGNVNFAVVVFDINNLKWVNDNLGHSYGDKLIKDGFRAIASNYKKRNIFRIGGDEFVAIIENMTNETYNKIFDDSRDNSYMDVFNRADKEMYVNKQELKKTNPRFNGICLFQMLILILYSSLCIHRLALAFQRGNPVPFRILHLLEIHNALDFLLLLQEFVYQLV